MKSVENIDWMDADLQLWQHSTVSCSTHPCPIFSVEVKLQLQLYLTCTSWKYDFNRSVNYYKFVIKSECKTCMWFRIIEFSWNKYIAQQTDNYKINKPIHTMWSWQQLHTTLKCENVLQWFIWANEGLVNWDWLLKQLIMKHHCTS